MARTPIVVGNWKLHKTVADAVALVTELKNALGPVRDVEVGVAPVFTALGAVAKRLEGTSLRLCAQDCVWEDQGAFTGEVSAPLLKDVGCHYVIVGHSERRQLFGELDAAVGLKARAVLRAGLSAIVCVGETEAQRDAGETLAVVARQLAGSVPEEAGKSTFVIAYEPVWAIGTGRTPTTPQVAEVHTALHAGLGKRFGAAAESVRLLYGGSVKPDNARELMHADGVDGALVGGASLKSADFLAIARACA